MAQNGAYATFRSTRRDRRRVDRRGHRHRPVWRRPEGRHRAVATGRRPRGAPRRRPPGVPRMPRHGLPCGVASDNQAAVDAADTVLLALRAADAPAVLGALTFRPHRRVISVMPARTLPRSVGCSARWPRCRGVSRRSAWRTGPV
ncbi:protein of unknown function [Micropruina glycogenica]|uniref:Pyrroline-5-carboxylate reductase catalytic N-terminal domain-containing protein n=1 Tax=Micropruina glycogenica TaxID=75385 RepID=A0A2N9JJ83_9ACTN|nr:protein of unknown function [Micropruina glycogenica]